MRSLFQVNDFFYWEQLIKSTNGIFQSNIGMLPITEESKICYIEFTDTKKNLFISGWNGHKDTDSILGFLQHVFLPTVYYTWIDRESQGFFIPLSRFEILKEEVLKLIPEHSKPDESRYLEKSIEFLQSLWSKDKKNKDEGIKEFCAKINDTYFNKEEHSLRVIVFNNPVDIEKHITDGYKDCEFEDVIEEELNISREKLSFICNNAYDEAFISKRIIHLLNTNIPMLYI